MKKLLFALLLCAGAASSAFGQSTPPTTWQEADGSPKITPPKTVIVPNGSISGRTVTITGGGGSGCTPPGTASRVLYDNGAGGCTSAAGFTFNGTSTISLGVAGTSVGAIGFRNATSGTITLQPVTGALGTVTLSLPAVTDTLVGLAATQTLTNKTLTSPVIAQISNTGTLTLPTSTDTLVGRATTDTLSNKTLASPTVTGNISAEATSRLIYGSNEYRYTNTTGPAFYDDTTGNILTFNVQSLAANRTVTFPNSSLTIAGIDVANAWADGVKQTFNPDATNAGINVGSVAGDPSAPANGDLWYDSTANELTARINGANVALGSGGGSPGGSNTQLQYNNSSAFGGISGVTSDGTNVTAGSGNLRATSPRITTSILDANGNTLLGITATGSATEYITIANNTATNAVSLTASSPTVAASAQAGTPFNLTASPAIAGNVNVGAAAGGSVTITAGNAARLTSGNAAGGNVVVVPGTGIGTGVNGGLAFGGTAATNVRFRSPTSQQLILEAADGSVANNVFIVQGAYFTQSVSDANVNVTIESAGLAGVALGSSTLFGFSSSVSAAGATLRSNRDTFLRRGGAAATFAFGNTDAASPVAQTLSVQNVVAGTSNTAGANWTFAGSRGTGTGAGGSIIFQTAPAGGSGTTQNTLAAAFTVNGDGSVSLKSVTFANLPTQADGKLIYCSDCTIASPCASGGSGALAKGINGAWVCN